MQDNDDLFHATLEQLQRLHGKRLSKSELMRIIFSFLDLLFELEERKKMDLTASHEVFKLLADLSQNQQSLEVELLAHWITGSPNPFADACRVGAQHAKASLVANNVRKAANGRRLIGANTREKVRREAASHMHKSKEQAAADMAGTVNLSIGHIKRLLSELFPGDSWQSAGTSTDQ